MRLHCFRFEFITPTRPAHTNACNIVFLINIVICVFCARARFVGKFIVIFLVTKSLWKCDAVHVISHFVLISRYITITLIVEIVAVTCYNYLSRSDNDNMLSNSTIRCPRTAIKQNRSPVHKEYSYFVFRMFPNKLVRIRMTRKIILICRIKIVEGHIWPKKKNKKIIDQRV